MPSILIEHLAEAERGNDDFDSVARGIGEMRVTVKGECDGRRSGAN